MKKLIFIFLFPVFSGNILLANASLFNYNEEKIYAELSALAEIEKHIEDHIAIPELISKKYLIEKEGATHPAGLAFEFEDIEWGSFAWGFCCFPIGAFIGVFTVLLNDDKDKNHKISYFIGMGVGFIVSGSFGCLGRGYWYY